MDKSVVGGSRAALLTLAITGLKCENRAVIGPFGSEAALDQVDLWLEGAKGRVGVAPKEALKAPPVTDIFDAAERDVGAKRFVGPLPKEVTDLPVDGNERLWIELGEEDAVPKGAKTDDGEFFWLVAQFREPVDDGLGHRHFP